jgi:hypothetical protein
MNQDAHLEDIRMPSDWNWPEDDEVDAVAKLHEDEIIRSLCNGLKGNPDDEDYMIEVMYGGQIDWDAEEW